MQHGTNEPLRATIVEDEHGQIVIFPENIRFDADEVDITMQDREIILREIKPDPGAEKEANSLAIDGGLE